SFEATYLSLAQTNIKADSTPMFVGKVQVGQGFPDSFGIALQRKIDSLEKPISLSVRLSSKGQIKLCSLASFKTPVDGLFGHLTTCRDVVLA
ncbi:MAG: hypothetical protein MJZ76_10830, partial [Bacteroidales bacterium]|nr:hypothetical protein [Bacteroidales bacterium]